MAKQSNTNGNEPANEPVWLSLAKGAPAASGKTKIAIKRAIEKYPEIFDADNLRSREVHPDYPPVVEITKTALDAWLAASVKIGDGRRAQRSPLGRRYKILIPDARIAEFTTLVTDAGFNAPTVAYKTRAKKARSAPQAEPAQSNETPALVDADLIEA